MDLGTSLDQVRSDVREQADLLDKAADVAADGGELQSCYRAMAMRLRGFADRLTVDQLDAADAGLCRDMVSVLLYTNTSRIGRYNWPRFADKINSMLEGER